MFETHDQIVHERRLMARILEGIILGLTGGVIIGVAAVCLFSIRDSTDPTMVKLSAHMDDKLGQHLIRDGIEKGK